MTMRKIRFNAVFSLLMLLTLSFTAAAADYSAQLKKADSEYAAGRYEEALDIYRSVERKDGVSSGFYTNLGNIYYKSGDNGNAVASYLKALRLNPGNRQARENLSFIRSYVDDANNAAVKEGKQNLSPDEPSFMRKVFDNVILAHRSSTWCVWMVVCWILFLAALALYFLAGKVIMKKIGFFSAVVLLPLAVVFGLFAWANARDLEAFDRIVVTEYTADLMAAPEGEEADETVARLHAGTELRLLEEKKVGDTSWYSVRLNSAVSGWIPAETAVRL